MATRTIGKFTVQGRVFWARVYNPDPDYQRYKLELAVDEKTHKKLEKVGLQVARDRFGKAKTHYKEKVNGQHVDKEYPGIVYVFKRPAFNKDGSPRGAPLVTDSQGTPVEVAIGNGTLVNVYGVAYEYNNKNQKGVSATFNAVQIIDLVEYKEDKIEPVAGGFVASSVATPAKVTSVETMDDTVDINIDDPWGDEDPEQVI